MLRQQAIAAQGNAKLGVLQPLVAVKFFECKQQCWREVLASERVCSLAHKSLGCPIRGGESFCVSKSVQPLLLLAP